MWPLYIFFGIFLLILLIIKFDPRRRGSNLPPIEGTSIPFLGCIGTFSKNPIECVKQAYLKVL